MLARVEETLKKAGIVSRRACSSTRTASRCGSPTPTRSSRRRISSTRASTPIRENPSYTVALNLLSSSPSWLTAIHALPMYLGLDLRGGVHFLLQVDMKAALTKRLDALAGDIRTQLRDKNIRHAGISARGERHRDQVPRRRHARQGAQADRGPAAGPAARRSRIDGDRVPPDRYDQAGSAEAHAGVRAQAEHPDAAQPDQRAGRSRAGHPAAGCGPRRGATARRAGHGEGEGDPRSHRHPRNPHGGRGEHEPGGARRRAQGQVPFGDEYLRRAQRAAAAGEEAGRADRRPPHRRAARLRQPDAGAGGAPDAGCGRARAFSRT